MTKPKAQHIKRIENNCDSPEFVQAFPYVEKWWVRGYVSCLITE